MLGCDGERIGLWWEEWRDMLGCDGERIGLSGRSGEICLVVMGRGLGCVWEEWRDMFGCDGDRIGFQIFPLMVES